MNIDFNGLKDLLGQKYESMPLSSILRGDLKGFNDKLNNSAQMKAISNPLEAMKTPEGLQQLINFSTVMGTNDLSMNHDARMAQALKTEQAVKPVNVQSGSVPDPFNKVDVSELTKKVTPDAMLHNQITEPIQGSIHNPAEMNIGGMQTNAQTPDLTAYERAFNSGDKMTMDFFAKAHPMDQRFQLHLNDLIKSAPLQQIAKSITGAKGAFTNPAAYKALLGGG